MLEVRQLERTGNRPGAIERGEALLREFPEQRRVEDALLNLYRIERRDEPLLKLLRHRTERDRDDLEGTRELVSLLLVRNRVSEGVDILQRFIAANPKDENRYRLAASLLKSRGLTDAAIQMYRDGREQIGGETLFATELAQLEEARGDLGAAIGEYLLLSLDPERRPRAWREVSRLLERADRPEEVISRVEELRKKRARSSAVQDLAAMVFLTAGRYLDALAAIREADRYAEDQGEHLLDFGRAALGIGRASADAPEAADVAVQALELLLQRHPNSNLIPEATKLEAEGLVSVARTLIPGENRTRLLRRAVQAIETTEGRLGAPHLENEAQALKGLILFEELRQPEQALDVFRRLADRQKGEGQSDEIVRVQLALCHAALGQLEEARSVLEEVIGDEKQPPAVPGQRRKFEPREIGISRARFHLAELDLIAGNFDVSRDGFAALAEEAPEDRLANDCLDLALVLNEAQADVPAALRRFGEYRRARILRDRDGMRRELESLVRENPGAALVPVSLYELGQVFEEEHRFEEALARYQEVLSAHAKHRLAPRALESIGDLQAGPMQRPDLAVASYEKLLLEYADDLFLDDVRKKVLEARARAKGVMDATP